MNRREGLSVRLKLTVSYAGFLFVAGTLMLAVVCVFLLRYLPDTTKGLLWTSPNRAVLLRVFIPAVATALAFLLVFGLLGGWVLAGRMLAPLTRIADAARMASNGSLSHRIRLAGREDEFRELADAFDTMLAQLEYHAAEQQRFAANASHELRTPLAISRTILDVARTDATRDRGELIERLRTVNTRAIDLTEALLLLSRSDRGTFTREPVDLYLIAEEAAETLLPFAEKRGITLGVTGVRTRCVGSEALILRMVTNLVQNAIVHNLTTGGAVTVHIEPQFDLSVLQVENTGRPIPPELVPALTEPFRRGTERVRTDEHAGAGLGLAIVRSVVQAHNGSLSLTPRPAGGLLVTIRLPGATTPLAVHCG
ncbi:sensor histidine kinase [Kibdelosporangium phytohabitans]|uniref:histidine kinase n=1 Tax=Kibdelosporangium phytohabitans TaxID=860235 RepID=A0A0N9HTP0_9PSEU|nr:HAMP domain-containing sensor histidine kinase [Kibdelosporangium phytohabitans]ALG10600.1 histidine kinase [Kibdelosporangium phytohabitans]MBE1461712.1 two-component system sensor histidine kinase VanS [Kibdelosporangium phytohabitans]